MFDKLTDISSAQQFDLNFLCNLYRDVAFIRDLAETRDGKAILTYTLPGFTVGEFFWQESSRTYHSFGGAARRLGANVDGERGTKRIQVENGENVTKWDLTFSSAMKDANLEDEVIAWASYYDALILRTPEEGMFKRIHTYLREFGYMLPLINAGDGKGEHPTQALLDLYTFATFFSINLETEWIKLRQYPVAFVNDCLQSRTIHSLAWLLGVVFKVPLLFISPPELAMPRELLGELTRAGAKYAEYDSFQQAPVYYVTRVQKEYTGLSAKKIALYQKEFSVTQKVVRDMNIHCLMHPFPRSKGAGEIPIWLPEDIRTHKLSPDKMEQAAYFYQMKCGLWVRMALLKYLLHPNFDMKHLLNKKLDRDWISQCNTCYRLEHASLGWSERPYPKGYIPTYPHIFCSTCRP
jgi:aspartate carbamoyltransferase catalytic subunit